MGQFDALTFELDQTALTETYDAEIIETGTRNYAHIKNSPQGLRKLEIYLEQKELERHLKDDFEDF